MKKEMRKGFNVILLNEDRNFFVNLKDDMLRHEMFDSKEKNRMNMMKESISLGV